MSGGLTLLQQAEGQKEVGRKGHVGKITQFHKRPSINELVKSASRVIAPLGPISVFAARNPWVGLEEQSFEQVASWLKAVCDVDMYPDASLLLEAKNRGEIDPVSIEKRLQDWLDSETIDLPREKAEAFCRASLQLDELPPSLVTSPGLREAARKLKRETGWILEKPVQTVSFRLEKHKGARGDHELNYHIIKWCKLYLNDSQAAWSLPDRKEGFYRAWRRLVQYDPALHHSQREHLKSCPEEASDALVEALTGLGIPQSNIQDYLEAHLLSLPGWAGMMLWRSQQDKEEHLLLADYLAVRLCMEWALVKPYLPVAEPDSEETVELVPLIAAWVHWGGLSIEEWSQLSSPEQKARMLLAYRFDDLLRRRLWLEAWEQTYEARLKEKILPGRVASNQAESVVAQFVFCMDTRSEPFRRALEGEGSFATYGTAGFFGMPIETLELGSKRGHSSLPVILQPRRRVKEIASEKEYQTYEQRLHTIHSVQHAFQTMKKDLFASLLLPEISGPWLSLQMLGRSLFPQKAGRVLQQMRDAWLRKPSTELSLDHVHAETELPVGFTKEEKVHYVREALKMMGLTNHFAPVVVICGHGSRSTNNPYASSLDCGACGGKSGSFNARVLATLCNLSEVRKALEEDGMIIPDETAFVAAEHITTHNELRWVYVPRLSHAAKEAFARICSALPKVTDRVNEELLPKLPNLVPRLGKTKTEVQRRAEDWSEIRPEWGLARNASLIIGGRKLSRECHLDGRTFLHDYDWHKDRDGALLANIIAGPATVAQWINLQYYASTVAPHYYGSGNKATQTVTAGLGVMQGNASDLLTGLPWQSVMKTDQEFYHSPLRLLVLIEAPDEYVERVLDRNPAFRQKVANGWIRLSTIDPEGRWKSWSKTKG